MFKTVLTALIVLSLAGAGATTASAQDKTAASKVVAKLSSQSLVGDLVADPDAKAILTTDIPEVISNPRLSMGYGLKLRDIAQFEPTLTEAMLSKIDKDLADMQAKRGH